MMSPSRREADWRPIQIFLVFEDSLQFILVLMAPILQFQYHQARRTGTSNALGELFDHGCDSVTTIFVVLGAAQGLQASVW
jgi:hypothetical protein